MIYIYIERIRITVVIRKMVKMMTIKHYDFRIFVDVMNGQQVLLPRRMYGHYITHAETLKEALFDMYETIVKNINLDHIIESYDGIMIGITTCQCNDKYVDKSYISRVIMQSHYLCDYYWY